MLSQFNKIFIQFTSPVRQSFTGQPLSSCTPFFRKLVSFKMHTWFSSSTVIGGKKDSGSPAKYLGLGYLRVKIWEKNYPAASGGQGKCPVLVCCPTTSGPKSALNNHLPAEWINVVNNKWCNQFSSCRNQVQVTRLVLENMKIRIPEGRSTGLWEVQFQDIWQDHLFISLAPAHTL